MEGKEQMMRGMSLFLAGGSGCLVALACWAGDPVRGKIIADLTSPYHHIQVVDEDGYRLLSFDGSWESQIFLEDPMQGHFEYTQYFHLAWLWNTQIRRVLMVGLGGGTTQRTFEHHYPDLTVETAELDEMVLTVARQYFQFRESARQKVHIADGRVFLRRSREPYDLILMDAYSHHRYGSFLPHHLVTKEFFALANQRLTTNGVLCYNVMVGPEGWNSELVGAVYKTLNTVFPQVYLFPVTESQNVILVGTKLSTRLNFNQLHQRATALIRQKRVRLPRFRNHIYTLRSDAHFLLRNAPVLTDDFSPIEGLIRAGATSHELPREPPREEPPQRIEPQPR